jgi:hypothetical protein
VQAADRTFRWQQENAMNDVLSWLTLAAALSAPAPAASAHMNGEIIARLAKPGSPAQREMPVAVDDRVRIAAPGLPEPLYGRVATVESGTKTIMVVTPAGHARVTLPLSAVRRIDVSRGRARSKSALVAGTVGLAAGGGIGASAAGVVGAVAFGGTAFAFSTLAGAAYAPERWRPVYEQHRTADAPVHVALARNARIKRFSDGTIGVGGERSRRRGVVRGAVLLGAVAAVFGGLDKRQGKIRTGEYAGTIAGNVAVGAALGYLISPRRWQRLPPVEGPREHHADAAAPPGIRANDGARSPSTRSAGVVR